MSSHIPEASVVDAHVHAWQQWPYLPPVPDPGSRATVEQVTCEMRAAAVSAAVVIGAAISHNHDNTDYLLRTVGHSPAKLLVFPDVGSYWSDRTRAEPPADTLRRILERTEVLGISTYLDPDEDGTRLLTAPYRDLWALTREARLMVSLGVRPHQVEHIRTVARQFDSVGYLLHHLGGVTARTVEPLDAQWAKVRTAATEPNIRLKVSGLPYLSPQPWAYPFRGQRWILRAALDSFGPRRLCWGSNYPVINGTITYRQSLEAVREALADLSPTDLADVLGGTMAELLTRRPSPWS